MTTELCLRMTQLPQYRGLPVPFFATIRKDGTPDFAVADHAKRVLCGNKKLCWLCGQALDYRMVFLGGPKSAASRFYFDGPMHELCARDAIRLCPFIVGRVDYMPEEKFKARLEPNSSVADPHAAPEYFVLVHTRGFEIRRRGDEHLFYANNPTEREILGMRSHAK